MTTVQSENLRHDELTTDLMVAWREQGSDMVHIDEDGSYVCAFGGYTLVEILQLATIMTKLADSDKQRRAVVARSTRRKTQQAERLALGAQLSEMFAKEVKAPPGIAKGVKRAC